MRGLVGRNAFRHKVVVYIFTERFGHWEEHTAVAHGVSVHVVEVSVRVRAVIVVQPVGPHHLYDGLVFHLRLGYIRNVNACRVALILHVEAEFLSFHVRRQIVDVFHHQPPVALFRIVACVLQRLYDERTVCIGDVAGKLSHLIGYAAVGIFVCDGQHLVGL